MSMSTAAQSELNTYSCMSTSISRKGLKDCQIERRKNVATSAGVRTCWAV